MSTLGIEAINAMVELSEKGNLNTYRGKLITPIALGQPIRITLNATQEYYVSPVQRVVQTVGEDIFHLDSGDGRRFTLRVVEMEKAA